MNTHLAILKKPYLDAILDGTKPVESRFTMTKKPPFGQIFPGDKIFLKQASGSVCATAIVTNIKSFSDLTPQKVLEIREQYNHLILGKDEDWQYFATRNFAILIWLKDIKLIKPVMIDKKDWRAWVILNERENYGLLGST